MADSLTQTFNELSLLMSFKNQWDKAVRSHMSEETTELFKEAMEKRPRELRYTWQDQELYKKVEKYGPEIEGYEISVNVYKKNLEEADRDVMDIVQLMGRGYVRLMSPRPVNHEILRKLATKHNLHALRSVI